jgi:large subunit ribosomal protein L6
MSRVGLAPVKIPKGVTVQVAGGAVTVKGPKGELTRTVEPHMSVDVQGDVAKVARDAEDRDVRARHGLMRADLSNMITGVSEGFERRLLLSGVGYRAQMKGKTLSLSVGFSHPVELAAPAGVEISTDGNTVVIVRGIDKARVGQVAANIRGYRPPEPYKGKGIAYEGEVVRRKEGKSGKK